MVRFSRGKVIGRQVLQLRICTCPKRDCEQDENRYQKTMLVSSNSSGKRKNFGHAVAGHVNDAIVQAGKRKAYWVLVSSCSSSLSRLCRSHTEANVENIKNVQKRPNVHFGSGSAKFFKTKF